MLSHPPLFFDSWHGSHRLSSLMDTSDITASERPSQYYVQPASVLAITRPRKLYFWVRQPRWASPFWVSRLADTRTEHYRMPARRRGPASHLSYGPRHQTLRSPL